MLITSSFANKCRRRVGCPAIRAWAILMLAGCVFFPSLGAAQMGSALASSPATEQSGPVQDPQNALKCQTERQVVVGVPHVGVRCTNTTAEPYTFRLTLTREGPLDDGNPEATTQHIFEPGQSAWLRSFPVPAKGVRWRLAFSGQQSLGRPMDQPPSTKHILPFVEGQKFLVSQISTGILTSHADAHNRHAVDFSVPVGTPVVATHDGVVAFTKSGSTLSGKTPQFRGLENLILLYDATSNTWTTYAHLQPDLLVQRGDRVKQGQTIAYTGSSGMMGGPHLHYAVEMRGPERTTTIPFQFVDRNRVPIDLLYANRYITR